MFFPRRFPFPCFEILLLLSGGCQALPSHSVVGAEHRTEPPPGLNSADAEEPREVIQTAARTSRTPTAQTADVTDQTGNEANNGTPDPAAGPLARVITFYERADAFNQKHPDFVCRLVRTERLHGTIREPELILMKYRQEPKSVYLKWLDQRNLGRECVWVRGQNRGKMISRGGKGDLLLAGKTLWLDPEGSLARSKSTQPITESGLDAICIKIGRRIELLKKGDKSEGTFTANTGPDPADESIIHDWIIHQAPPGVDADLKEGGRHHYGFDQETGRLAVTHAFNTRDEKIYTFRFDRFIPVTTLTDADFDPDAIWPRKEAQRGADPPKVAAEEGSTAK